MAGPLPTIKFLKGQSKNPIVPGICVIDEKFKFFYNKTVSDGQTQPISLFYQCGMKKSMKCSASVILIKLEDKWWPQNLSPDEAHNHPSDRGAIVAEIMKKEMFAKVARNPETKADDAFRDVVTDFEDRFEDEELIWDDVVANLPNKETLSRNMRHIRSKQHGPLPRNRNDFDPETVVNDALGGRKVIVMDSNKDLDEEYYVKVNDFENNRSDFVEDLEPFIRNGEDNLDTQSEDEETSMDEVTDSEKSAENLRNPFFLGETSSNTSNESANNPENLSAGSAYQKKPKRIIAYSTKKLLKIFAERKASGDGFKICPSLWKQLYILMVKFSNSWIPVCYALLPDKCKETYFTFFYMVKKKIQNLRLKFKIESMRMDFEVGAMKAAAAALKIDVKGCYFHFTQSGWRFVQTNNMASAYLSDMDQEFKLLVKCVLSLPHIPVEDLEDTIKLLSDKVWEFEESPEKEDFKNKFLKYVSEYWLNGQIPPQVWNCFHRKVDLTNNNNESHNSYLNNTLKEAHPSPATLTVALVKELTLAETKLRKVKSGAKRILKQRYQDLNVRRNNLKKMYYKLDRIEYLSQVGNIVMHIQLNQGQMAELRAAKDKATEEASGGTNDDSHLESSSDESDSNGNMEMDDSSDEESFGGNETLSSAEGEHPFVDRVIGKVAANGKKKKESEVPEYKNKKCLACGGKFNVKSKYQVCKLCDKLIHVNNNKKCHKMKNFLKDRNYVCLHCKDESEENLTGSSNEASIDGGNGTYTIDKTVDQDFAIDGSSCNQPSIDTEEETSRNHEDLNSEVDASTSSELEHQCFVCSFATDTMRRMNFHMIAAHSYVICQVCTETFTTHEEMLEHMDEEHDKIEENPTSDEEQEFRKSIQRQSTAVKSSNFNYIVIEFVSDAEPIKDLKKKRGRRIGT